MSQITFEQLTQAVSKLALNDQENTKLISELQIEISNLKQQISELSSKKTKPVAEYSGIKPYRRKDAIRVRSHESENVDFIAKEIGISRAVVEKYQRMTDEQVMRLPDI